MGKSKKEEELEQAMKSQYYDTIVRRRGDALKFGLSFFIICVIISIFAFIFGVEENGYFFLVIGSFIGIFGLISEKKEMWKKGREARRRLKKAVMQSTYDEIKAVNEKENKHSRNVIIVLLFLAIIAFIFILFMASLG